MDHIGTFEQFNESRRYNPPYHKVLSKVYTRANDENYQDSRRELEYSLQSRDIDPDITLNQLIKHPKFDSLNDDQKDDIMKAAGTGRTPNAKFVKDFVNALNNFQGYEMTGHSSDEKDRIYQAARVTRDLEEGADDAELVSHLWDGLRYRDKKSLREKYGTGVHRNLTEEEIKHVMRFGKRKLERFADHAFSDQRISEWLKSEIEWRFRNQKRGMSPVEEYYFTDTSWTQKAMEEPLEFVKEILMDGGSIDWDKFSVEREMLPAEHSKVVSSSFTTWYYYKVKLTINGKTFDLPKVQGGSSHYSGGWD